MDMNFSESKVNPFNGIRFSAEGTNPKVKESTMIISEASPKVPDKIFVDEFLVDLIPNFIKNKIDDLAVLKNAAENRDFETIKKIGHNWKGVCSSYGFKYLGETGKQFEYLAQHKDLASINLLIDSLPEYLRNVQIESVPEYELDDTDVVKN